MAWERKPHNAAHAQRVRDYNSSAHKRQRREGQRLVDRGLARCWRCGSDLPPGCQWHVGHDDHDRSVYRGPECVPCNVKAAASKGARIANARRKAGFSSPARPTIVRRSQRW